MTKFVAMLALSGAMIAGGFWSRQAAGDEQAAGQKVARDAVDANADNPLADVAVEQFASPRYAAPQKVPQIIVTFQYGEREPSMKFDLKDTRPVTEETTVYRILEKAKSATTIYQPAEAKITVLRPHSVIGDDLNVNIVEETLSVVWDRDANRPTDETNYKLQPGDRILVKQAAPQQQFIAISPQAPPIGVWTPTIPPPSEAAPARAVGYVVPPMQPESFPGAVLSSPPAGQIPPLVAPAEPATDAGQVLWKIQVFTDPKGNMDSFQTLRTSSRMVSDSDSLLGAIGILENNKLIEFMSRPTLVGKLGRPVQFEIESAGVADDAGRAATTSTAVEIKPSYTNSKILALVTVTVRNGKRADRVQTAAELGGQQTMIVKAPTLQGKPIYVVLTPELVSPLEPAELQAMAPRPTPAAAPVTAYSAPAFSAPSAVPAPPSIRPPQMAPGVPANPPQAAPGVPAEWLQAGPGIPAQWPQIGPGVPAIAPVAMASPHDPVFGAVQPTQFSAPQPMPVAAPRPPDENPSPNKRSQIRFEVAIVEDTSGSMTEIIPTGPNLPCVPVDSQTMLATLRILEKHKLIKILSIPKLIAASGEQATLEIGQDAPGDEKHFFLNVIGRELGGGLAIEFKLQQDERDRNLGISIATIVAHGQTIVMKRWPNQKAAATAEAQGDGEDEIKVPNPVYVFVTPQPVR